jgi:hypothetical protein
MFTGNGITIVSSNPAHLNAGEILRFFPDTEERPLQGPTHDPILLAKSLTAARGRSTDGCQLFGCEQ